MHKRAKFLLAALYPLLVAAFALNRVLGKDPLRLRANVAGGWIERRGEPDLASYFCEGSLSEGAGPWSAGRIVAAIIRFCARFFRPPEAARTGAYAAAAEREKRIPDEVYTLW